MKTYPAGRALTLALLVVACTPTPAPRSAGSTLAPSARPPPTAEPTVPLGDRVVPERISTVEEPEALLCSPSGWCWVNPLPQGNVLGSIWMAGPDDIWAAGNGGTLLHFDGSRWEAAEAIGTFGGNQALWGRASDDIYAVGAGVHHYDGSSWSQVLDGEFVSVWGAADVVFALGPVGEVAHHDGGQWRRSRVGRRMDLSAVWASGPRDAFAVGAGVVAQFDGRSWRSRRLPGRPELMAVWGSGPRDVWAVGSRGALYRYDGRRWRQATSPGSMDLHGIWGSAPDDVFIAANDGRVFHWDGRAWELQPTDSLDDVAACRPAHLLSVHGVSGRDVVAAGWCGMVLRFDGERWSSLTRGHSTMLYSVGGSAADDVYATGADGLLMHFEGARWTQHRFDDVYLNDVWSSSPRNVYVVGSGGTILHFDGAVWRRQPGGTEMSLHGVWGSAPDDVWAVGGDQIDGVILHFDGVSWTRRGTEHSLNRVWGSGSDDVWAVGDGGRSEGHEGGTVLHWDGASWSTSYGGSSSGLLTGLNDVWGTSATDVYAVGEAGLFLHYDGQRWTSRDHFALWSGVTGTGHRDIWAIGTHGMVHFDGSSWTTQPFPSSERIRMLRTVGDAVYAVGPAGNLLRRRPRPPSAAR